MNIPQVRRDPLKWQQRISSPRRVQDLPDHFSVLTAGFCYFSSFYYLSHFSSRLFQFVQLERPGACHCFCRVE